MISVLWSILGFVVVISLLVTIHEAGHFLIARWFNIKATVFSIGFGKSLLKKQIGETEFRIALVPLGGYVKLLDERNDEVIAPRDLPRAFNRQSVYKRFAVVLAGPMVNLIFAWLAFSMMYFSGVPGLKPLFQEVEINSPLATALKSQNVVQANSSSLKADSYEVVGVNNKPVHSWNEIHQSLLQALVQQRSNLSFRIRLAEKEISLPLSLTKLDLNQPNQNWLKTLGFVPLHPTLPAVIDQVQPNSAASSAKLQKGDKILKFDRIPVTNWQELVKLVQQHPSKQVQLLIERKQKL